MMRKTRRRLIRQIEAAMLAAASSASLFAVAAPPKLPVPCAPAACGSTGPSKWVTAGAATAVATQNALTVTQTSNSTVLNWSSFDIGANGTVTFKQPSSTAVALNKIYEASPSQIFGNLSANGQVYLINLNGFLFGPKATINVGSLLVSSLPLTLSDANFGNGILSVQQNPLFDATLDPLAPGVGRASVLDANGNPVLDANGKPVLVQVLVQPGAQLTSADQGRIFLTGQNVTNGGTLTSPDGQVILAAGSKIYLQADTDPSLRGLIVEVDPGSAAWNQLNGIATNQVGGTLTSPRGNVTMVGLAVNQDGRISATTSVSANGSIRLEAASGAAFPTGLQSTTGGALTLGPQSQTQILPELSSSATATSASPPLPSSITLLGEQVILQGGSITAPNGNLTAIAAANPGQAAAPAPPGPGVNPGEITNIPSTADPNARLRIDPGTTIDLSGSTATLPVSANLVSAQLRSSELADDPTQRNGALHGLTVYVDARNAPSPSLADVSGEIAAVPQTIAQLTETGGKAVFESEGDAVLARGASVNVSGGSTTYSGGVMQTSYLVGANGQLYPIATANPLQTYVGVVNPTFTQTYNKWGVQDVLPTPGLSYYQPGYVQGAAAGAVQFVAPTMVLQGTLQGSAVNGLYQRTPATAVSGGTLILGLPKGTLDSQANSQLDYVTPAVRFTASPTPIVVADDTSLPGPLTLDLPVSYLTGSGFTSTQIYSNANVVLPTGTPLSLPWGSTLSIDASRVDILSNITDADGTLNFQNVLNVQNVSNVATSTTTTAERLGVFIGDGVTLDVRGLWTNDMPAVQAGIVPLAQTWQDGGQIELGVSTPGALLSVGNDVTLHASGGAWMQGGGTLVAGKGGHIALISDGMNSGLDVGQNLSIDGFGVNGASGGKFDLTAPRLEFSSGPGGWTSTQQVDDTLAPGGVFQVNSNLFSNYGFQTFNLTASGLVAATAPTTNVLTVDAGTAIDATVSSWYMNSNVLRHASATSLNGIATVTTLAPYERPPATVNLDAIPYANASNTGALSGQTFAGDIDIQAGASITTDPLGTIGIVSPGSLILDGVLRAPGGNVSLQIVPSAQLDIGFLPTQRIELGATSTIDVSGTFVPQPSTLALDLGTAYAGGSVSLIADRGAVVTDVGSQISVAGTSAAVDILQANGRYGREVAATAGGSLTVFSGESISLLGGMNAAAGTAGSSGPAAAGSLDVILSRAAATQWSVPGGAALGDTFNQAPLAVELVPSVAGTAPSAFNSNLAVLGATQISQAGFDSLTLEAGDVVQFSASQLGGAVSLNLGRQFIIDAPAIGAVNGAHASVSAPYVEVGYTNTQSPNTSSASGGSGSLSFSGNEIDLVGTTYFQGTQNVSFKSAGDLLLRGEPTGTGLALLQGSVTSVGNLTLDAARIYPVTATTFAITADPLPGSSPTSATEAFPGTVTIAQNGADPGTPLSAGGAVTITADSISSTGTLYAPFGTITLLATQNLTLGDGSLTSVSGGGLTIPYGQTSLGGQQWIYENSTQPITGVPARTVSLQAPSLTITKNATIDLSGGGDLQAYEWVPGPGGTKDVLTANPDPTVTGEGYTPGLYAIMPAVGAGASPLDPLASIGSTIPAGETVYLSGGSGLPAGTYTILPPRYALEPGAFLIQTETQFQSTTPGTLGKLADGTPVVGGFLSYGATGLHQAPGYIGFAIYPGSYGSQLAQYDLTLASSYFSAAATAAGTVRPTLPADAGTLVLNVPAVTGTPTITGAPTATPTTNLLDLQGQVLTAAATGGLAAPIDISANDLFIGTSTASAPADSVSISSAVLNGWQPGSLLLGGCSLVNCPSSLGAQFTPPTKSSGVVVSANTVTIGAGSTLTADEISLVANQSIEVQSGATLQTTSASTGTALKTQPATESVTLLSSTGTPSLLSVSDLNWLIPVRAAGASATGAATVAVDSGATIASRGALSVDGVGGVLLSGAAKGPGAEWSLGSSSMAFVPAGSSADALAIDPALLSELNTAGAVRLASSGAIDVMTNVAFGVDANGKPVLGSLTLSGSSLNNLTGSGGVAGPTTVQFGAQTMTLEGSGASSTTAALAGPAGSTLKLSAGVLDIGPNQLVVNGFAATDANVTGAVIGQGSGTLNVGGDLTITSAGVTAAAGATTNVSATGALAVAAAPAASSGLLPSLVGGALTLSGASVDIAGTVAAPSGLVTLSSTNGNVTIDAGASVSTAGTLVTIQNQSINTPGGVVVINSAGNLTLSQGANLDVAGSATAAGGAAAAGGSLTATAAGATSLGATVKGGGGSGDGGSFSLDTGSLVAASGASGSTLDALSKTLTAGEFTGAIDLRTRSGDLTLDAGNSLTANAVTLTADAGQVTVGGSIEADSGALRGAISIFGGAGVELTSSASLSANGVGASGRGGTIEIGAGHLIADQNGILDQYNNVILDQYNNATIRLDAGSKIAASGAAGMGTLLLRAPALIANNDIGIQWSPADTTLAVGQLIIEPVLPFNTADKTIFSNPTTLTTNSFGNVQGAVANYIALAASNLARFTPAAGTGFMVEPGVEIIADGALTLESSTTPTKAGAVALDLSKPSWRFGNAPIDLTILAAGDLNVVNTITDGFTNVTSGKTTQPLLLPGASASIRLVAGADLSSANPLQTAIGGEGTLTIGQAPANPNTAGTPAVIRTGTGDIDLVAAQDIIVNNAGSGAYTAGVPAVAPGGDAATPYPMLPPALGSDYQATTTDQYGNSSSYVAAIQIPGTTGLFMSLPAGGGNLEVQAGGNIQGAALTNSGVPSWQLREGGGSQNALAEWGVNLAAYNWTFGTLGGGDLNIAARGNASYVTAAAADSLLPQYGGGIQYVPSGGLSFHAGGNIGSTQVFLADGTGTVTAGGALIAILPSQTNGDTANVGSAFYLQSSTIDVTSRLDMAVDGIFNPTGFAQLLTNAALGGAFLSYSPNSSLSLNSLSGDIVFDAAAGAVLTLLGKGDAGPAKGVAPASLSVDALNGSIVLGTGATTFTLYPAPLGQLDLLAAGDIRALDVSGLTGFTLSDAVPGSYATVATPVATTFVTNNSTAFTGDLHIGDPTPALITAGGSIESLRLSIPKVGEVIAGKDITDLTYLGQNLSATDQTVISAGRDISYTALNGQGIEVGGPGEVDVLAGRNVELGFSQGIVTIGNLANANLPTAQGADLTIATGLGTAPDFTDFVKNIIANSTTYETESTTYQTDLVNYVESLQGSSNLTFGAAEKQFLALTPDQQRPLIDQVFFNELLLSGRAANATPSVGFSEGYAAIDALFPGSRTAAPNAVSGAYAGDLSLTLSRIYTLSGGNISLVVPGGNIDVGLAVVPPDAPQRSASQLGIVAQGSGNIDIYSKSDVNVNSSRIFTLGGGNILIWSNEGSIDAGRGSKTSLSAPPPTVSIDNSGNVTINFSGAAEGSGIRTIQTEPNTPAGSVDLDAPVGTVNAGDAGIGAAGNINIAAASVLGVSNINFGGTATGVPAQISSVGASLSGASAAASSASNTSTSAAASGAAEKEAAAPLSQAALSWLDVFVTGLGEENCKPDDIECLKRQKTATH
jgi:filamentous hemagglutinin